MKSKLILLFVMFVFSSASAQTVKISASEPDANIIVNGANVGTGSYKLSLDKKDCYKIKVEKAGFLRYESTVCGKKAGPEPPSSLYFEMKKDDAIALGAMALFGEKYGEQVRVVIMDENYSIELCGGTHAGSTGNLGFFKIKHETAVAAGVRRLEAVCGNAAENLVYEKFETQHAINQILNNPADLKKSVALLVAEKTSLQKRIESLEARQLVGIRNELLHKDEIINNVTFIADIVEVSNADALKKLCFDIKNHIHDHIVVLCSNIDGKAYVAIGISDTVVKAKNLDAGKLIKEYVAPLIQGGGGGQKNLATAGGQIATTLQEVIDKIKSLL